MMESSKSNKFKNAAIIITTIAVFLFLLVLIIKMFAGNSTYTSTDKKTSAVDVLNCISNQQSESFLNTTLASQVEHKIKITFSDAEPNEIMYSLSATYPDAQVMANEGRTWVTDYGIYMADNQLDSESIDNTFSVMGDKAFANFYTNVSNINAVTAKIFFLTKDNYLVVQHYNTEKISQYYENLGFQCNKINQ